jgi:lipoate---protein ligase
VRLEVQKGIIRNCKIYGDFFGVGDIGKSKKNLLENDMRNLKLKKRLQDVDIKHYFGNIEKKEFIDLIY